MADGKVQGLINIPENFNSSKPTELVIFATPNNTGPVSSNGTGNLIGAQAQELRASSAYNGKNLVIAYLSPANKKWPSFLDQTGLNARSLMDQTISHLKSRLGQDQISISVEGHSGGGAFISNMIDKGASIPNYINKINFYDAIYAYNGINHAQKIKQWLDASPEHRFTNIAATPQIKGPQKQFIADLQSLGVSFEQITEAVHLTTLRAFDGRLKFTTMSEPDHVGAIKRNSFTYAHNPDQFTIAPLAQREQTYQKLSQMG